MITMARTTPCRRLVSGANVWPGNDLGIGGYYAAVDCAALPSAVSRDDKVVARGYVVGNGQWWFFNAFAPAVAFGRASRMSAEVSGYGVFAAARETSFCPMHGEEERILHI